MGHHDEVAPGVLHREVLEGIANPLHGMPAALATGNAQGPDRPRPCAGTTGIGAIELRVAHALAHAEGPFAKA